MTIAVLLSLLTTYGPWVVSAASAIAAVTPPANVASNPIYTAFSGLVDFLALNFGQAKK